MPNSRKINPVDFLSKLPLFNDFEAQELEQIAAHTSEVRAERGNILFHRGEACTGFHTIVYGRVKLSFISSQGVEKVIEIIGPGQSFGEALMFMDKPYIVSAQALVDTLLLHIEKSAVLDEIERTPMFARKMLAGLSRRLHSLICDVEAYSLNSGTQRVIGYLLKEDMDDGEKVALQASKATVASRLNLTPESFSRILHDLVTQQLIVVDGREITIPDVEKLRAYQT